MTSESAARPPRARHLPQQRTVHGITRTDSYSWLRADNWQQVMREPHLLPADIREYLEAENRYTESAMADTEDFQEQLFEELKGRIKQDDTTAPAPDGPFAYYMGYSTGAQHPRYCRKNRLATSGEQVLLDGPTEAAGKSYFRLGALSHSPDHRLAAWSCDVKGSEFFTIRIRDLATGRDLPAAIENSTGEVVWASDSGSFFYVENDENHRPCRVWHHLLGSGTADRLVYEESEPGYFIGIGKTSSGAFVVISSHDHESSEVRVIPAAAPSDEPLLIARREPMVEYEVDHREGQFVFLTNRSGAEDFKIATAPGDAPGPENWRDLVPHRPGRLILSIECFKDYLVRLERQDGLPQIVVRHMGRGEEHSIAFAESAYSLGLSTSLEHDTEITRFTYSSMTTPAKVYDYNMRTRQRRLLKEQEVPSGHDPSQYETRRTFAVGHDGEAVPISLLYRKGLARDGSAPCWLYGYGSYGIAIPAAFNANWLSLANRGFVCAIAHVRGGKDRGHRWYLDGKREKKTNTFKDFIAAAHHLCSERFTAPGRIVAHGGSAGGMLMGVIANLAPELFRGIIADVPFVDVLNTMLDDSLPLTPPEWQEWGNPIESKTVYELLASYSPYENVTRQAYPHILAIGGLTDPRVTYWEPAKWVARLRAHKTNDTLLLLKTHMDAGHAGAPGRFDRLKEVAFVYAFGCLITGAGLDAPVPPGSAPRVIHKPAAAAAEALP
ncbi:MAG: S9 family peptidase [Pseudomonadota bacterium]|nr:S9 family peptidase [Pseudomonadota bacterium]